MRRLLVMAQLMALQSVAAADFNARLKGFGVLQDLPTSDIQRAFNGNPALDASLDLRMMLRESYRNWQLTVEHSSILVAGDTYEFGGVSPGSLDQAPSDDDARLFDLTWTVRREDRSRLYHRFDRLALRYQGNDWGVTLGREALSWGSGKVFHPMDVFAPFAPTTVDRDYKPGEDLILIDKLFTGGSDLQLAAVMRRDEHGDRDAGSGSYGVKWHSQVGENELELVLGRHRRDDLLGIGFRLPLGGALLQTDWTATRLDEQGNWKVSGVLNVDYSFSIGQQPAYAFAEFYRNGFGRNEQPVDLQSLNTPLRHRLSRGEVFTLMKNYLALGGSYQWHPLWVQSVTVIWNLQDYSALAQGNLSFEPNDSQRIELGFTLTAGDTGDEYGRLPLPGMVSTGGGSRVFLRWAAYW